MTGWRKSSFSGESTNCVEVAWRKSTFSGENTNCVEVAATPDQVAVRDSKDPAAPHLTFPSTQWRAGLRHFG